MTDMQPQGARRHGAPMLGCPRGWLIRPRRFFFAPRHPLITERPVWMSCEYPHYHTVRIGD
jgi:hypothetical protein